MNRLYVMTSAFLFISTCLLLTYVHSEETDTHVLSQAQASAIPNESNGLKITAESNKSIYKNGEDVILSVTFTNTSMQPIALLNHFADTAAGPILIVTEISPIDAFTVAGCFKTEIFLPRVSTKWVLLGKNESYHFQSAITLNHPLFPGEHQLQVHYAVSGPADKMIEQVLKEPNRPKKFWKGSISDVVRIKVLNTLFETPAAEAQYIGNNVPLGKSRDFYEKQYLCSENLKQLGLVCRMYAQDYGRFPDDLRILYPSSIDSGKYFKCAGDKTIQDIPKIDRNTRISYTYIKGLTAKRNPDAILAYDTSPDNHEGGRNVLFLDGHVIWCDETHFQGLMKKQEQQ